jgi:hypothetical protein
MRSLKSIARSARLGRVAYHAWHRPVAWLADCLNEGGPFEQFRTRRGRRDMETEAAALPELSVNDGADIAVHVLTGRHFWYQTAFCLWSLARQAGRTPSPVFHDDGSLDVPSRTALRRIFPLARFVDCAESISRLETYLPSARYPVLRERWLNYPHIRKIIDPHLGSNGWKLVLDSDLLFFRPPSRLLAWVDHPERPLHALDCKTSYGYPLHLMSELAGQPVADLVNVGLTGLNSGQLDWDRIEQWCNILVEKHGTNYFLEQAIVAMIVAGRECAVLPAADYVTFPKAPEVDECRAVMHHYVAGSKRWYFQKNWQKVLEGIP